MDFRTTDYPVSKCYGQVVMTRRHIDRDLANGGRTSRAAERLAAYRLRVFCRGAGVQIVSTPTTVSEYDLMADSQRVAVVAKVIDAVAPVPYGWMVPDSWGAVIRLPAT